MLHPAFKMMVRVARDSPEPHPSSVSIADRRQAFRQEAATLRGAMAPLALREDSTIELEGRTLRTRLYVPTDEESQGLVVFFHGGSFVMGDLDTHEWLCRRLAEDTRMRFLAVEYRLAPEHPFPAALEDTMDVLRFVAGARARYGPEGSRLIAMGDSAGANLVTVAATLLRGETDLAAQVLIYPTLGPELVTDSAHQFGSGYLLDMDHLRYDYGQYLRGVPDHTDPRVTPLLCSDLIGVPAAIVVVAECDPLRDEAVAYAGLLGHFGANVQLLEAKGMVHGFLELGGVVPEALAIVDDLAAHLHRLLEVPA